MSELPETSTGQLMAVDHPRIVRPLPRSGEADCPQCHAEKSVARHNADWTCHKCGFLEIVDEDKERIRECNSRKGTGAVNLKGRFMTSVISCMSCDGTGIWRILPNVAGLAPMPGQDAENTLNNQSK